MRNLNLPAEDPNVKIPPAIRAAALRSEEAFKLANGEGSPEAEERDVLKPVETFSTDPKTQEAQERQEATSSAPESVQEQLKEVKAPIPAKPDDWEQKFRSAQGRLDKQAREHNAQIAAMNEQLAQMQNLVASLQSAKPDQAAPALESYVTPEDRETYGDDFLNVVERKAKELVAPLRKELEDKIKQLDGKLGNVGTVVQASAREKMFSELDSSLPEWREINTNPKFIQWLKLPDIYSGDIRQNLLMAAFERNNSSRVAAFFKGFLAEEAAVGPDGEQPNQSDGTRETSSPTPTKVPLENLAAPGRAKTAAGTTTPAEKPFFTRAQIAKFYADVTAGRYRGREDAKNKLEGQIFSAQAEGRIRN